MGLPDICGPLRRCLPPLLLLTLLTADRFGSTLSLSAADASMFETRLKKHLFTDYDVTVRPANFSAAVLVKFDISLNQLIDLDERNQILMVSLWYRHVWTDDFLKWNTSEYGGIKNFRTRPTSVWVPDITLYNDVREEERSVDRFDVIVHNEGRVQWNYPLVMRSACRVDVRYFPFDQQICKFKYGSWGYDGFRMDLQNSTPEGDLSNFVPNGEWSVMGIPVRRHLLYYTCCPEPYPDVTFYLVMRRRALFYLFNLVLPCVVIMIITFCGFLLPPDSGEKVSLGVTCLLALTVFLLLVAETMPPQSEVVPLIGQFFGGTIILLSLSTAMTVMVLHLHFKGQHQNKMPSWLRRLAFSGLARVLCLRSLVVNLKRETYVIKECHQMAESPVRRTQQQGSVNNSTSTLGPKMSARVGPQDVTSNGLRSDKVANGPRRPLTPLAASGRPGDDQDVRALLERLLAKVNVFEQLRLEDERSELIESEWRLLALLVDRLLLLLFMAVGAVMTLVYLVQSRDYSYDLDKVV